MLDDIAVRIAALRDAIGRGLTIHAGASEGGAAVAAAPAFAVTTKERGEYAELLFLQRALRLGYVVSKPYGDSAPYDFVVGGSRRRLKRVQVKSLWWQGQDGRYAVAAGCRAHPRYTAEHIDVLAVYLAPKEVWYIIPVEAFAPRTSLTLRPWDAEQDEWRKFREAWWRLGRVKQPRTFVAGRPRGGWNIG